MQFLLRRKSETRFKDDLNAQCIIFTTVMLMAALGGMSAQVQAFSQYGGTPPSSLPIKDTDYAIPLGAVFAAPSSTADLAAGSPSAIGKDTNAGTLASPWTLTKALSASLDGATIVVRGGNYRGVNLSFSHRNTVQAYPHEAPWIRADFVVPPTEFTSNGVQSATATVFCPTDNYVQDGSAAGSTNTQYINYNSATDLLVKTSGSMGLNRDAYFKFNLLYNTNITRARFRFYAKVSDTSAVGTSVYPVADTNWSSTGTYWSTKPAQGTTALGSASVVGTTTVAYDVDITSYVQSQKTAGNSTISFALHNPVATSAMLTVASRESVDTTIRPVLLIDAAPTTWSTPTKPTTGVNVGKTFEWGIATDDNYYYDKSSVGRASEKNYTPGFREILFIDGTPIDQVDSLDQVTPTTFYVDRTTHQLHIGVAPTGKTIELNASSRGLYTSKAGSMIRGLGFMRFADEGVRISAQDAVLENCTCIWNGQTGMSAGGNTAPGMMIRGNMLACNGRKGGTASDTDSIVFENNVFYHNNVENFTTFWDAGGIKVATLRDPIFRGNVFQDNDATGLWMDINVLRAKVYRNIARHNKSAGLFFEISHDCVFAFNLCVENGTGILLSGASGVRVYNNTLATNVSNNISVKDNGRENNPFVDGGGCGGGGPLDGDPFECGEDYASPAAGSDWVARDNIIKNNIFSSSRYLSGSLFDASGNNKYNPATGINDLEPSSIMFAALDYNAYYRPATNSPPVVMKWYESSAKSYTTLAAFKTDFSGPAPVPIYEAHGVAVDNATDPFFVDGANGSYLLKSGSPASGTGEAIPADIAALVGVPSSPANMGAFGSQPSLPPSNLTATATSADRINLTWQDNAQNESGFRIERSPNGTTFTSLTTVGPNITAYADKNLAANTLYYYRVRSFDPLTTRATAADPQGESAPTNIASAKTGNFVTREPIADSYVRASTYANNNYGTGTTLDSKWSPGGTDAESRDVYIKFDLSGLNGIVEADLKLYITNANTYTVSIAPYALADPSATSANWIESGTGGITWNNKPAKDAIALTPTVGVTASSSGWYEWDISDFLRAEKDAGRTSVTLVMNNANTGNFGTNTPLIIASKEATTNHPQLLLNSSTTADKAAVVTAQSYAATEDIQLIVPAADGVLKGATDADGNALTAKLAIGTTNGAVSLSPDGSFLYRPKSDFNGTDSFTFVANDGILDSSPKTVTINVAAINDAPRHKHPAAPSDQPGLMQVTNEDTPLVMSSDTTNGRLANNVSINDVDIPAGSSLTLELWVRGVAGTVTLKQTTGLTFSRGDGTNDYLMTFRGTEENINAALDGMTFAPLPNYSSATTYVAGTNYSTTKGSVRFMSNDANALNSSAPNEGAGGPLLSRTVLPIVILAVNDAPTATDDSFTVAQGSSSNALTVLTNDVTTPDVGESLIITSVSTPTNGTATISADKLSIIYTPGATFTGADSLTYTVNDRADGSGQSDTATASINVVAATCASDVSSSVSVTRDGFTRNRMTGRWIQTVIVKNTSSGTLNGPLYVVFDALSPTGQSLDVWNKTGLTTCAARAGKPYMNLSMQNLAPGATLSIVIEFTNPNNVAIAYNPLVLSGPGKP